MKQKLILITLFVFLIAYGSFKFGLNPMSETLTYDETDYEQFSPIPMAFGKDTILPDMWVKGINVDGDIKRVIRFCTSRDTTIFPLPNAVNGYTSITCYSLKVNNNRYLWFEDNFGTTVFDIDLKKLRKTKKPTKELIEIAPTGAQWERRKISLEKR